MSERERLDHEAAKAGAQSAGEEHEARSAAPAQGAGRWRRYPAYRDSGVEWLGEIPEHWKVNIIKRSAEFISRGNSPDYVEESPVPVVSQACIQWDGLRLENVKYQRETDISCWKGRLYAGDVLVNSTGTGTLGRIGVFKENGLYLADGHVTIIRVKRGCLDSCYVAYLLGTSLYQGYIYSALISGSTNQIELSLDGLRCSPAVQPPLDEQYAIGAFLDRETARIDALIAKKERLIELLQEKRTALISRAVTFGFTAYAHLRDSGDEHLGRIPGHWQVVRLKFAAGVQSGVAKGRDLNGRQTIEMPYLRVWNVQNGYVDLSDVATIEIAEDEVERYLLQPGDVLMTEGGDYDKLGRGTVWEGQITPCIHQNHIFAVRPKPGVNPYWISLVTQSQYARNYFILRSKQSTNLASISSSNLMELPLVMPPLEEQSEILAALAKRLERLDQLLLRTKDGIDKLREYRAALISAAVTGKIDVREGTPH